MLWEAQQLPALQDATHDAYVYAQLFPFDFFAIITYIAPLKTNTFYDSYASCIMTTFNHIIYVILVVYIIVGTFNIGISIVSIIGNSNA